MGNQYLPRRTVKRHFGTSGLYVAANFWKQLSSLHAVSTKFRCPGDRLLSAEFEPTSFLEISVRDIANRIYGNKKVQKLPVVN